MKKIKVIDLFCGIGGLSRGLIKSGLNVVAGIDNDSKCKYGYEHSNKALFIDKDINNISAKDINQLFGSKKDCIRVLAGCAPCQPYSRLNLKNEDNKKISALEKFANLINETLPDIVSMENVPQLRHDKYGLFKKFINILEMNKYKYKYKVVNASLYGVPQKRRRLVLLASRFGEIDLIEETHKGKLVTVRDVIYDLPKIKAGEKNEKDKLHISRSLSELNMKRIKATPKNGGTAKDWDESLLLECYKKETGKTYMNSVYGRMRWNEPAPTMTTQCIGLGNGRFGHPEQNRAISLREAALFQSFPKNYIFFNPKEKYAINDIARFIGNAVPVRLGEVIGDSIIKHIKEYGKI